MTLVAGAATSVESAPIDLVPYDISLLDPVRAPGKWGVFASVGPNFQYAIFGRDPIEAGEDLLHAADMLQAADTIEFDPQLVHDIIITMARLQGTEFDPISEEEPGKIHHEYRASHFDGVPVPEDSLRVMRRLKEEWGYPPANPSEEETFCSYSSFDATPLFMRLVGKYTARHGDDILSERFVNKDGVEVDLMYTLQSSADWLTSKLQQRDDHLLAYKRTNPKCIQNQVWKDSCDSYLFSDGTMPDPDQGIVSTELQGYAYDALKYVARVFPNRADEFDNLAADIQRSTLEKLWMPEHQFFAQGLGVHPSGEERVIDTLTSNGALILDSELLAGLPDEARDMYVNGIERQITSNEFLTPAGIRCRALGHAGLLNHVDYHGSLASWPKETSDVARGLTRFSRIDSASLLQLAMLDTFKRAGGRYELFYVDTDNTVYYDPLAAVARFSTPEVRPPTPEPGQAWSETAAILAYLAYLRQAASAAISN